MTNNFKFTNKAKAAIEQAEVIAESLERRRTMQEERMNSLTHAIAAILSLGALVAMLLKIDLNNTTALICVLVYGLSMTMVFTSSALLHRFHDHPYTKLFDFLDHFGIHCLIAGTYTPFLLLMLKDGEGTNLLYLVWGMAAAGILYKLYIGEHAKWIPLVIYTSMGWVWLFKASELSNALQNGMEFIMLGGALYMIGVVFYLWERLPYNHAWWHIFSMSGTFSIYLVVYYHVL